MVRWAFVFLVFGVLGAASSHPHDVSSEPRLLPIETGEEGTLIAALPLPGEDGTSLRVIHAMRLTAGLGSNPLGLDRGWGNSGMILRFSVSGDRVIVEAENHTYRAGTDDPAERRAVAQSFARSVIFSAPVRETTDDSVLFDIEPFLTRDLLGLAGRLEEEGSGGFKVESDLSRVLPDAILAFPLNTEIDTEITFVSDDPGPEVRQTAPYPGAVTLTVHHSFVALPGDGYEVRLADERIGTFSLPFYDFSAPLGEPVAKAYARRHRLSPDNPIVFYVDNGAPEPVRSALVEGASWWAEGFAAAGYPDGYRVEVLPEDAHPLDARYNVIQWVHRQTRGWSYGGGVVDPRTGEFIRGHVILGSQRVRQDRMIFEGLAGTAKTGTGDADDPIELALARIRQLAAHEVGHSLGFGHNFAASANGRASVMDYPAPWVTENDGVLDFSKAYTKGLGPWDILTVRWLYGDEDGDAVVAEAREAGLLFIEDSEGRGAGTAHPLASVWDNGSDPVKELDNVMRVRKVALENFGEDRAASGQSASQLRQVLVPIYLYHRYQTAAAAKLIGGASYQYAKLGEDTPAVTPVSRREQMAALDAILDTVEPEALDLPDRVAALLPPGAGAHEGVSQREAFESAAGPVFDRISAAGAAADLTFGVLLAPERLERLALFAMDDPAMPSVEDVLGRITGRVVRDRPAGRETVLGTVAEARLVAALIGADRDTASPMVRGALRSAMTGLAGRMATDDAPPRQMMAAQLSAHLGRTAPPLSPGAPGPRIPPGSPIGESCWHCE